MSSTRTDPPSALRPAAPVSPRLHRIPRHPHAWAWLLLASQLGVAAVWWMWGWRTGLLAMLVSHGVFFWGALWARSRLYGPVLSRLPLGAGDARVWLTIDDGPSDETLAILDLLDAHAARATFFVVGDRAAARPELVRGMLQRGHTVGNHSASHPAAWFWALPARAMAGEITRTQAIVQGITGQAPRWFRAVVGMANPFVAAPLRTHGLARVAWSARGFDGVRGNPGQVVARIERALAPGAIVLLHEGAPHGNNVAIIALLLQRMQALGYTTVLPEDIEASGVEAVRGVEAGSAQQSAAARASSER